MKRVFGYLWRILFFLYVIILLKGVIFKLEPDTMKSLMDTWDDGVISAGMERANFTPLRTITMYVKYWHWGGLRSFENLVGNVVAFIPFGYFLPSIWRPFRNLFFHMGCGFLFVFGIELFQLVSGFGAFDVDDIILNCAGILLGYLLYSLISVIIKRIRKKEKMV